MAYGNPVQLRDFAPDEDPRASGVLVDCDGLWGTTKGLRTLPSWVAQAAATLPEPCIGAYSAELPNGDSVVIAGTNSHLYRLSAGAWAQWDGGQTYHASNRWRFTTFGWHILATNMVDPVQVSDHNGQFTALAGNPPTACIVEAVNEGVFLVCTMSNQWYFTLDNDILWTPDVATGTVTATLVGTPGPITAFHRIRGGVVAYKRTSLHFAQFSGPPFFWPFNNVSETVGCFSHEAVVNTGDMHLFPSLDDFWSFDGSSLQRVPNQLKEWFFRTIPEENIGKIIGVYDKINGLAIWYFPDADAPSGTVNTALIYNVRVGKWTKSKLWRSDGVAMNAQMAVLPAFAYGTSITYDEFAARYGTYDNVPQFYDSPELRSQSVDILGLIGDENQLYLDTGAAVSAYLVTGEIGDGNKFHQLSRVRPIFAMWPSDNRAYLQAYKRRVNGYPIPDPSAPPINGYGPQAALTPDGAFNFIQTARSHQLQIRLTGDAEITALSLDAVEVGDE